MRRSATTLRYISLASGTAIGLCLAAAPAMAEDTYFSRLATLPAFLNLPQGVDPATPAAAEIITATGDGMGLIYSNSPGMALGFIDITDPKAPRPTGQIEMGGEPTSVTVIGNVALVGVNTSESKAKPSGHVAIVDLTSRQVSATCDVKGQPDSVAVSPDKKFLAVAIENERDEELNDGVIPQMPAGHLAIFNVEGDGTLANCDAVTVVPMTGLAAIAGDDPEPEFVDINNDNIAAVTLQENNHIALVDLAAARVSAHFSAGSVDLEKIDANDDKFISAIDEKKGVLREPDAIGWLDTDRFVVANEGDYEGGSRSFTIFDKTGRVLYEAGNAVEHLAMANGQFPVKRAKSKGVEPEGLEIGKFGDDTLIFVLAERGNFVAVYRDKGGAEAPEFLQFLPTAIGPEGAIAIPSRGLFAIASETESAEDNVRASVSLYARDAAAPFAPAIVSETDPTTGAPIGWGALSGLAADPAQEGKLFAVSDSIYGLSRIYDLDATSTPARITGYVDLQKDGQPAGYDVEGIALAKDGGFWLVSEGNPEKELLNKLLKVGKDGTVAEEILLPDALTANAERFGLEGIAAWDDNGTEKLILAIQREWKDDPKGLVKLAIYEPGAKTWSFVHYPLEKPKSANKGWVGLSEITYLGGARFALIERDNQPGIYAAIKNIATIDLADVEPKPLGETLPVIKKKVAMDVLPLMLESHGWISDKIEGLAVTKGGQVYAVIDNDGVADATGETQFLRLGTLDKLTQ
jgi:hypothetical protein